MQFISLIIKFYIHFVIEKYIYYGNLLTIYHKENNKHAIQTRIMYITLYKSSHLFHGP